MTTKENEVSIIEFLDELNSKRAINPDVKTNITLPEAPLTHSAVLRNAGLKLPDKLKPVSRRELEASQQSLYQRPKPRG